MKRLLRTRWLPIHLLSVALLASTVASPAVAALKAGDTAPDFTAQASRAGQVFQFSLKDARKAGPVVVYFYPSAFTEGCNIQAREFAVHADAFSAAGATVIGVSLDNIARLNDFSADPEYCGGKVPVASDADGRIARSYDVTVRVFKGSVKDTRGVEIDHGFAERTTYIVSPDGKVVASIGGLAPAKNVEEALAVVRRLRSGK